MKYKIQICNIKNITTLHKHYIAIIIRVKQLFQTFKSYFNVESCFSDLKQ